MRLILTATVAVAALGCTLAPSHAQQAQQGQQWFVPGGGGGGGGAQAPRQGQPQRPTAQPQRTPQHTGAGPGPGIVPPPSADEPEGPPLQVQLPPLPELPALARSASPPAAVIGVLSARDVFRGSAAAQQLERILGERKAKFEQDVQKEQNAWRELQQAFSNQRGNMTPEQIRAKERELQDRVTNAQRQFRDRQRILQQASEYAGTQIERATIMIVRQVADSRGINLVLHREQVLLNTPEFDLTEGVIQQLNRLLPTVLIPPDGVALANFPPAMPPPGSAPSPGPSGALGGPAVGSPLGGTESAPSPPPPATPASATPPPPPPPAPPAPPRR